MKTIKIISIAILFVYQVNYARTYEVISSGATFSPANLVIEVGDTVKFTIGASHNAVEVSKSSYDANDATSNNGFNVPFGGGTAVFSTEGTFYYVCTAHISLGMKGTIEVKPKGGATVLQSSGNINTEVNLYPNPTSSFVNISFYMLKSGYAKFSVFDITGRNILSSNKVYFQPGAQNFYFDLKDAITSGKYILKCEYANSEQCKILIVK